MISILVLFRVVRFLCRRLCTRSVRFPSYDYVRCIQPRSGYDRLLRPFSTSSRSSVRSSTGIRSVSAFITASHCIVLSALIFADRTSAAAHQLSPLCLDCLAWRVCFLSSVQVSSELLNLRSVFVARSALERVQKGLLWLCIFHQIQSFSFKSFSAFRLPNHLRSS